jgi:(p)ppGpp synthase/HD superfamily hydrolase
MEDDLTLDEMWAGLLHFQERAGKSTREEMEGQFGKEWTKYVHGLRKLKYLDRAEQGPFNLTPAAWDFMASVRGG